MTYEEAKIECRQFCMVCNDKVCPLMDKEKSEEEDIPMSMNEDLFRYLREPTDSEKDIVKSQRFFKPISMFDLICAMAVIGVLMMLFRHPEDVNGIVCISAAAVFAMLADVYFTLTRTLYGRIKTGKYRVFRCVLDRVDDCICEADGYFGVHQYAKVKVEGAERPTGGLTISSAMASDLKSRENALLLVVSDGKKKEVIVV